MVVIFASQTGPMASQSIVTYHTWRWTLWISVIMTGILLIGAFILPETYAPVIARAQARKSNQPLPPRPIASLIAISLFRPLHMLAVEPIVFPSALVLSVTQSIIFTYYVAYSLLFRDVYHFTNYQVGLAFAPLLVGSVVAMPIVMVLDKVTYQKAVLIAKQTGGTVAPEKRLYPVMLSAILLPISLFW
jgi:MFS family permease